MIEENQQIIGIHGKAAILAKRDPEKAHLLRLSLRVETDMARAILLSLPEEMDYNDNVYTVDARSEDLGAGVQEVTFFVVE